MIHPIQFLEAGSGFRSVDIFMVTVAKERTFEELIFRLFTKLTFHLLENESIDIFFLLNCSIFSLLA